MVIEEEQKITNLLLGEGEIQQNEMFNSSRRGKWHLPVKPFYYSYEMVLIKIHVYLLCILLKENYFENY